MYCIQQNKGKAGQLAEDLQKIVPHLYGDHASCGTWCKSEQSGYTPKNLPYGKPLTDEGLRVALNGLFSKYADKAEELACMGSTQSNESFNQMVATKAPKRLYYGGSESLKTRVSAAVCQKNDGYDYITELNKKCVMSPGKHTQKHIIKMGKQLKRKRLLQKKSSFKRRRLELKSQRYSKDAAQSILEGDTYSSNISLESSTDIEDITPSSRFQTVSPRVFFDLETTGLARTSDIVQIAAVCEEQHFNVYMVPSKPISIEASNATGITYTGGILRLRGEKLDTVSAKEGLEKFIVFIKAFKSPLLIGHNIQNYDLPVLMKQLTKHQLLDEFKTSVGGFVDTLKLAKLQIPKAEVGNYKQENLVKVILGKEYEAHNALADVSSLQDLFEQKLGANSKSVADNVFHLSYYSVKSSLEPLLHQKVISPLTMRKLVQNSFSLVNRQRIHARDPQNGIRSVFSEAVDERSKTPRITKSSVVIDKLIKYFNR